MLPLIKRTNPSKKGFLLFDVALATGLMLFVITPIIALLFTIQNDPLSSGAPFVLYSALHETYEKSQRDFHSIKNEHSEHDGYTREITVKRPSLLIKQISITVSWGFLPWQKIETSFVATNYVRARDGSSCNFALLWPDWSRIEHVSTVTLPASTTPTGVLVKNNLVYVTLDSAVSTSSDVMVFDIEDPHMPLLVSHIDTGPGIADMAVWGNRLYVAQRSTVNGLQIITIEHPRAPALLTNLSLPGVVTQGQSGMATAVAVDGSYVVVGTSKNDGKELFLFKREENGTLHYKSNTEIGAGVNDIAVDNHDVFVASPLNNAELTLLSISTEEVLEAVGTYDAPGGSGNGKALALLGDALILGRTVGNAELHTLSLPGGHLISTFNTDSSIHALQNNIGWLFGVSPQSHNALELWQQSTTSTVYLLENTKTIKIPGRARALSCWFTYVAVVSENPSTLTLFQLEK